MNDPAKRLKPHVSESYRPRGGDGEGVPTPESLRRLGVDFAIGR